MLHIDFETRSDVDLTQRGAYIYFESPHTQPLMCSYAAHGGRVKRWLPHQPCPPDIAAHVRSGGLFCAHNAGGFERLLWQRILTPRYDWPEVKTEQFVCTMAMAAALGLPRSLDKLGEALNLDVRKEKTGKDLIRFFSLPRKPRKGEPPGLYFNDPADFPEKFEQFRDYCDTDVLTEMEAYRRMIPLSDDERAVWALDQKINDRGVRIDRASCEAAIMLIDRAASALDREMAKITNDAVTACSQVARLTAWLQAQGVPVSSLGKDKILSALALDDIPKNAQRALEIRQEAGKSSTAKLKAFLARASSGDRLRGVYQYHGAGPGRWTSGAGVNLANLPRPRDVYESAAEKGDLNPASLFEAIRTGDPGWLRFLYGPKLGRPHHLISDAIRGFIWAAPGREFISADYSNIQGCIAAWIAGEEWKMQAFREVFADPKNVPDLYRRAAAGILNTTTEVITKKHPMRQIGKVAELALGFGGSVAAFHAMSVGYGVDLDAFYGPVWESASEAFREKAQRRYAACLKARDKVKTDVLSREAWLACYLIVLGWRAKNAKIAESWRDQESAARNAILCPGEKIVAPKVSYLVAHGYLWCRLPSGRCLAYAAPRLKDQVWAKLLLADGSWGDAEVVERSEAEKLESVGRAEIQGATSPKITALGVDSTTKKMARYALYGGLQLENLCMAIERDILVCGMKNVEAAGYPVVAHTYDELVSEVPNGYGSVAEYETLMCNIPAVYDSLPIAASGWRGKRYRK